MTRLLGLAFGAVLALSATAYVVYDAWAWDRAAKTIDSGFRKLAAQNSNERPGAIYLEPDSYYWLSYAKRIGEGESLRVRFTHGDNAPYGRPVHWSQSISWLLVIFGKTRQFFTGESWTVALEQASVWVNPLLLILLSSGVGWALWKRVGAIPAGLFMVNLVALGDVGWEFQALRPDHQSLQALFGVFMLAGLVFGGAGWINDRTVAAAPSSDQFFAKPLEIPELGSARRWFLVSGAFAALSLWVSAVVAEMLLLMLFGTGLLLAMFAPKLLPDSGVQVKPELWRWWGWIAGAGSLLFYLVEYFPAHLGFRLEVNGPLYSIGAVAIGEAMCQFLRARYAKANHRAAPFIKGLVCTGVVALVPLAIFLGPESWHAIKDPQMFRLHKFIQEFYSFRRFAGPKLREIFFRNVGILPLFIVLAIGLITLASRRLQEWAVLWLSLVVTVGTLGLGYFQVRWLGLYASMNAWLAVVTGICLWRLLRARLPQGWQTITSVLLVLLLLVQPIRFMKRRNRQVDDIIHQRTVPKELANPALNKRLALAFRAEEGPGARVMASLDLAPQLHYFGDASAVAAYYWEDLDGLHAATKFFADTDGEAARQVAIERGLTHVIVQEGNSLQNYFYFIATGKVDQEASKTLFAARLVGNEYELPRWLQTVPALHSIGFQLYTYGGMQFEERWRLYRIQAQ